MADVDFEDPLDQRCVLHEAVLGGHQQQTAYGERSCWYVGRADPKLASKGHYGATALHEATAGGHVEIVSNLLLLAGINKDAGDCQGDSALVWAASSGRFWR